jgi:hypothetical protein
MYLRQDSGGSSIMKKIMSASLLSAFAFTMLLPVAGRVNATSVDHSVLRQSGNPIPPNGGGGHFVPSQSGNPIPPNGGGGHFASRQSGNPIPPNGGGGH